MFAFLSPYKLFIEIGLLIAVVLGAVVGVHKFLDYEQQIGYDRAVGEYNARLIAAQEKATADTAALNKQLEDANNAATQREQVIQAAANAANASNASLRSTINSLRDSVSGATAAALANAVVTTSSLLGGCSERYSGVAEKAGRHANDAQRLQDSWPKIK